MVTEVELILMFLTSIDVAAHEIGHAVCENSKLSVPKESGAMKAF
jgi:Zn-dependent metalloprotease